MKPVYKHDCDKCIYLGTLQPRAADEFPIDTYWCTNPNHPNLSSIIGREGDDVPNYVSSHPPEAFASKYDYLNQAGRWYLYALLQASLRGLYKKPQPKDVSVKLTNIEWSDEQFLTNDCKVSFPSSITINVTVRPEDDFDLKEKAIDIAYKEMGYLISDCDAKVEEI